MLIYDHNKNFVGIDDDDLRLLGFSTTEELKAACSDIAEFFVKKPCPKALRSNRPGRSANA